MVQFNLLQTIVLWAIPLLFAIIIHEVAHGWVAYKLGDPTAKMLGRLTLNPIKHIDPLGTIVVPALCAAVGGFIFGWAKPVPITWQNLKSKRWGMALVAFAGPLANIFMAIGWAAIAKLGLILNNQQIFAGTVLYTMGKIGIYANCMLGILNLFPLQPLDGGRVFSSILPRKAAYYFDRLEPYGLIILLVLLISGVLGAVIFPLLQFSVLLIRSVFGV